MRVGEGVLEGKSGKTFLPDRFMLAHELCFTAHDFLLRLLRSAGEQGVFTRQVEFRDEADKSAFEAAGDIFEWFETTGRMRERERLFRWTVFPALLSDFLHFVYEALEASRKAKLGITYALLRKPIQENLFVLEVIASDLSTFSGHFATDPLQLRAQKAGGVDAHRRRIQATIDALGLGERFDAAYLAQLRYDKRSDDSFDASCNKAMHLFTEHEAIRTEKMNINFIFSGWESMQTQWAYLYSRLPYVLLYAHSVVEHVFGTFERSDADYVAFMQRRLAAAVALWHEGIEQRYRAPALDKLADSMRHLLDSQCRAADRRVPRRDDLVRMRVDGSWPGQSRAAVAARDLRFAAGAKLSELLVRTMRSPRRV